MYGNDDAIRQIRERLDVVEVIGKYVALKKRGKNFVGLSPFRTERTPSFNVSPEKQYWKDFGSGDGGDIFTFIMKKENVGFGEAMKLLAEMAGVSLTPQQPQQRDTDADNRRDALLELNETAALFFQNLLAVLPQGKPGRDYMAARGISKEIADEFGLGYAPDAWEVLANHLRGRGYDLAGAVELGLLAEKEETGRTYDRFRGRFMFPIRDRDGRVIGFGGRDISGDQPAKYINSKDSALFNKSRILYGIDRAQEHIRRESEAVIVEGYVDALTAHQFGYRNVVATMGTALTEQQVSLVKKLTTRLVLALDADAAGQMAMLRAVDTIRGALGDAQEMTVDAHGLIRSERRVKVQIAVLTVPGAKDPDEFIRANPSAWPPLVSSALPVLDYVIETVVQTGDTATGRGKTAILARLAPIINDIADRVERGVYIGQVARMLRVPETAVAQALERAKAPAHVRLTEQEATQQRGPTRAEFILSLLVRFPKAMPVLLDDLPADAEEIFPDAAQRAIWDALIAVALDTSVPLDTESVQERLPEELHDTLQRTLAFTEAQRDWFEGQVIAEVREAMRVLLVGYADERIKEMLALIGDANEVQDMDAVKSYRHEVTRLLPHLRRYPPPSTVFRDLQTPAR